ncbi:MAG: AzlC family ABC transporter permease [Clostridiaceae bacterium]
MSNLNDNISVKVDNKRNTIKSDFYLGFKKTIPITLGYIPISFTFGLMAVNGDLPIWTSILISLSNFTSAGQFAGTGLIITNGSLFQIALTTFVINIRYMLMSLSLSQKITKMSIWKKAIIAFGVTDETFTIASLEEEKISFSHMIGIITGPYFGWAFGTVLGAVSTKLLPDSLQNAMGIALYGMFIALIIPAAKKSKDALVVVIISIFISSAITWIPGFKFISSGWNIVISTVVASSLGALLFQKEDDEN